MNIEFLEPALIEWDDAIEYYSTQSRGLGDDFFTETLSVIRLIIEFPAVWTKFTTNTRKATYKRFPYNIIYTVRNNSIYIIALAHHHRNPEYWINRIM